MVIVTPNPEQLVESRSDPQFALLLNQADVALPDGIGIAAMLGVKRIPGIEFMEDLARMAADRSAGIGLIGGSPGLAVKALECLCKKYSGLHGWATTPEESDVSDIIQKIKKNNTKFVFVGLGAPKQELFIETLKDKVPALYMSVGGSFDVIAGRLKRAPLFIRSIGFEWAWRLFQEPWRWKRQLALVQFVWLVMMEKLF